MKRSFFFIVLSVTVFLLSACTVLSVDGELNLEADENWSLTVTALLPADEASFLKMMDEEELMKTLGNSGVDAGDLPEGVIFDVKILDSDQDGNVPLQMSYSGKDYDALNGIGDRMVWTEQSAGAEITYFEMEGMGVGSEMGMDALSTSFTLHANGSIVESNGEKIDDNSVVWRDFSGKMTATIEPSAGFDFFDIELDDTRTMILGGLVCCLCLLVIVIVVVVVVIVINNKKKQGQSDVPPDSPPQVPPETPEAPARVG